MSGGGLKRRRSFAKNSATVGLLANCRALVSAGSLQASIAVCALLFSAQTCAVGERGRVARGQCRHGLHRPTVVCRQRWKCVRHCLDFLGQVSAVPHCPMSFVRGVSVRMHARAPQVGASAVGSSCLCAVAPCSAEHVGACSRLQASQWSSTTALLRVPSSSGVSRLEGGERVSGRRWKVLLPLPTRVESKLLPTARQRVVGCLR